VILSTIEPGGGTGDEAYSHDSDEEVVIVLQGRLELWVADEHHVLEEGDTVTYSSRLKHWNRNSGETTATVLFCLTPPSF
jgi:quercetin dioxygenase-like cupin family protein